MVKCDKCFSALLIAVAAFGVCVPAEAQSIFEGRTAAENLIAATGGAPGQLVAAGLGRAQDAANRGRAQVAAPQITATSPPTSIRAQFLVEAIDILLDHLERTLLFLGNRWLAREGFSPLLPADAFFPPAGTEGGGLDDLLDLLGGGQDSTDSDATDSDASDSDSGDGGKPGGR